MKNEHDFKTTLRNINFCLEMINNPRIPDEDQCIWSSGSHERPTITAVDLKTMRAAADIAAEQKTVDVEVLKRDNPDDLSYKAAISKGWNDCIDHLAAQGYLRTPDTKKDRVLELMAGAVSKILQKFDKDHSESAWWYTTSDEVGLLEDALSEYEKLKVGA